MDEDSKIRVRAYYAILIGRARRDSWRSVGAHLKVSAGVAAATYAVGFALGTRLDGKTLTAYLLIPLAALVVVVLAVFIAAVLRTPVLLDQEAVGRAENERQAAEQRLEAANRAAAERSEETGTQLRQATEHVERLEAEPVAETHCKDLQRVAVTLQGGIRAMQKAYYLPARAASTNIAYGFQEHFPDEARDLHNWNELTSALEAKRKSFRQSLIPELVTLGERLGMPLYGGLETGIAYSAELDVPELRFGMVAGYWQMGHTLVGPPNIDRAAAEKGLREILFEATVSHECTLIVNARRGLEALRDPLMERLLLITERVNIPRGKGCRLCGDA
jgi:hypothetical protein